MNKALLIILGSLFALFVLAVIAIGWWWSNNADSIKDSFKDLAVEGQAMGARLDEQGCLSEAGQIARAGTSFMDIGRGGALLTICLHTAKPSNDFCEGVPPAGNIMDTARWTMDACPKPAGSDQVCQSMMQHVAAYCTSPMRAEKLKKYATRKPEEKP